MRSSRQAADEQATVLLAMLNRIGHDRHVTQRHLAKELGIALGLTNAYLKRCVKKGLVKVRQVPLNRYAYYLTSRGFAEKTRLTREYLLSSFDFFRRARRDCAAVLDACRTRGCRRIVLWGTGDLVEIAILSAAEAEVTVVCIVNPDSGRGRSAGHTIVGSLEEAMEFAAPLGVQAILVTDLLSPQQSLAAARVAARQFGMGEDQVIAIDLMSIGAEPNAAKFVASPRAIAGSGRRQAAGKSSQVP